MARGPVLHQQTKSCVNTELNLCVVCLESLKQAWWCLGRGGRGLAFAWSGVEAEGSWTERTVGFDCDRLLNALN